MFDEIQNSMERIARDSSTPAIFRAISGFLSFLFGIFANGSEGPDADSAETEEEARAARERGAREAAEVERQSGDTGFIGRLRVSIRGVEAWRDYQENQFTSGAVQHISPVAADAQTTSGFGPRSAPRRGASRDHKGIDLSAPEGTPILASAEGVILFSGYKSGYGYTVMVGHADGSYTLYGHLQRGSIDGVEPGEHVRQGAQIGRLGNTGVSTGPHLHYEQRTGIQARDPLIAGQTYDRGERLAAASPEARALAQHGGGRAFAPLAASSTGDDDSVRASLLRIFNPRTSIALG